MEPPTDAPESCCPPTGREALLIGKPQDKRQSISEPSHVLFAETPDLLADPLASHCDRFVGHHLRFDEQSIFGRRLDGDPKIRSVHQFGSHRADHHRGMIVREDFSLCNALQRNALQAGRQGTPATGPGRYMRRGCEVLAGDRVVVEYCEAAFLHVA